MYKTIKETVFKFLESNPSFRERKNKNKGIAFLLSREFKKQGNMYVIFPSDVTQIVQESASYDRAWRQILEQNPHLRGKDYDEKHDLEEKKQEELGYLQDHLL